MLLRSLYTFVVALTACFATAGEVRTQRLEDTVVYELQQSKTVVRVAPKYGANAFSIRVDGVEFLRQPEQLAQLAGVSYGNPILYPTPNRVRDAEFTFEGDTFKFEANAGKNFIHGLVNQHAWKVIKTDTDQTSATIVCQADFTSDSELYRQFPRSHALRLTVVVRDRSVRWQYEVDNSAGDRSVPFGFALHPYFVYQGARASTMLTIPASHWMESEKQLPTGKLVPAAELDYELNQPMSLETTTFDDVFWGLHPEGPTFIEFRDVSRQIAIHTSPEFTHLVVWTPDRPYFGVESQTCSTDAHNMHSGGKVAEAHLQICQPGSTLTGWVEYRF